VPVVRAQFDGAIHGFMTMPTLEIAQEARKQVCAMLGTTVGPARG